MDWDTYMEMLNRHQANLENAQMGCLKWPKEKGRTNSEHLKLDGCWSSWRQTRTGRIDWWRWSFRIRLSLTRP